MFNLIPAFMIGLIGSAHCLGMCGPLVLAFSLQAGQAGGRPALKVPVSHHVAFHAGRLISYGFLGALAAALFSSVHLSRLFLNLRGGVTLISGSLMVLLGLVLLKLISFPAAMTNIACPWKKLASPLLHFQGLSSKLGLGLAMGFLPCGLSWAMIAKAAATRNMGEGFLTMAAFGLGTVPALFIPGLSASLLSLRLRLVGEKIAGISVIVMGVILLTKGSKILH